MTEYSERLDDLLTELRSGTINFDDKSKQAITSLIKELVAEVKPDLYQETWYNKDLITPEQELLESQKRQYNRGINQFEQNLLKALSKER